MDEYLVRIFVHPITASKLCLTVGTEQMREPKIPVRAYAMAQKGSASGSFADNAAVPSPCALFTDKAICSHKLRFKVVVLGCIYRKGCLFVPGSSCNSSSNRIVESKLI